MPTYEYHCKTCGKIFESVQTMSAEQYTHCLEDVCEHESKGIGLVERKIGSGAGLIFSGSGFYHTDYKNSGQKRTSSTDSGSEQKPGIDSTSSTDKPSVTATTVTPSAPSSSSNKTED